MNYRMKNNNSSEADYFFHEQDKSETCFRFGLDIIYRRSD
jgi:hypothetical protein